MAKKNVAAKTISVSEKNELMQTLRSRFEKNTKRHKLIKWEEVEKKLNSRPEKLWSLLQMEQSGGEPDVVELDKSSGELMFIDCSPESPKDRRSICYDIEGLESRKEHRPENTAIDMASEMGIELLDEEQYRKLQEYGHFDAKTSSWLKTPQEVRKLGGAIFGDYRYGRVFIYHNGAQSYYGSRGFRGLLKL